MINCSNDGGLLEPRPKPSNHIPWWSSNNFSIYRCRKCGSHYVFAQLAEGVISDEEETNIKKAS